jgi:HK97 family phage prohead protease
MPIKPEKGESQSDWMLRCVPEMMGHDGGTKRPQEQAVAACLNIWRKSDKSGDGAYADPGYQADGKKRFALDSQDDIRAAFNSINKSERQEAYTTEQVKRIKARIVAAWKDKIDPAGPPSAEDKSAMATLHREVVLALKADCPDPEADESHDDFIDRCKEELNDDMDEDEAEEACQLRWDEWSDRGVGEIVHKTHATPAAGMEFVLSDASPDRFGDVVEVGGWDISNFKNNPVALFNHDKSFIVGKWQNVSVRNNALRGELVLAPKGTSPRIDEIRRLVEADILRAVSVGFRPLKYEPMKGDALAMRYLAHELVESSLVAVPANANALAVAKSLNITPATVRLVFGEHADKDTIRRSSIVRPAASTPAMSGTRRTTNPLASMPKPTRDRRGNLCCSRSESRTRKSGISRCKISSTRILRPSTTKIRPKIRWS